MASSSVVAANAGLILAVGPATVSFKVKPSVEIVAGTVEGPDTNKFVLMTPALAPNVAAIVAANKVFCKIDFIFLSSPIS
jgi:hypothetical protein